MDSRLQEAIGAARAGETRTAQQLLTDVLRDDPAQTHAWFLLSHLVDSPQKQQAYLGKVLTLEPDHKHARQRLAFLRAAQVGDAGQPAPLQPAAKIADAALDVLVQAEGDTLPDWMAEDAPLVQMETAVSADQYAQAPPVVEELPTWLRDGVSNEFLGVQPEEEPLLGKPTMPVQPAAPQKGRRTADPAEVQRWNLILLALGIAAMIVLVMLINALLSLTAG